MIKRECIINYAQSQTPVDLSTLGFPLIKTEEQFLSAYKMHDMACQFAVHQYLRHKYAITPLGIDLRQRKIIVKNELPNYIAEKEEEIFCFDPKAKSSIRHFGWVNERAVTSYRQLAKECGIPVYLDFIQVVGGTVKGETGYCNIEDEPSEKRQAWNGNIVWIYEWKKGLARIGAPI